MKTLKPTVLIALLLCFTFNASFSQKMYQVHVDYVKPSKLAEYNKTAKEFVDACKKYNPQAPWITATTSDNKFLYVSSLKNFAELDKNPFSEMAQKMGDDWENLFKNFNTCYDKHGDYILVLDEGLTYMPEGISQTQEGQNYRKYFFLYYTPQNQSALRTAMKGIKDLFVSKGSKEYYRVYHSGFGVVENYYLVAVSAKDEIDQATKNKANNELLGDAAKEVFEKMMNATSRFEEISGWMRPDLSYSPK